MAGKYYPRRVVSDDGIIADYRRTNSSIKTAQNLDVSQSTVLRILHKHNIPRDGLQIFRRGITKFQGQEAEIREAYESGATIARLSTIFGSGSDYSFHHAIRRAGGVIRPNPVPTLSDDELKAIRRLGDAGLSQMDISHEIGRSQTFVSRVMRDHGIRNQQFRNRGTGRHKNPGGYVMVSISVHDPLAEMRRFNGYVLEHRLVMARRLGRPLTGNETVHHINGVRDDNRIDNLQLRKGKHGKHSVHICADCGSFNIQETAIAEAA